MNSLTPKQQEVLKETLNRDWFMLILHGGVRSGKTTLNNILFLMELQRVKEIAEREGVNQPSYILATSSASTMQSNIIDELANDYGLNIKFDRNNNFTLFGVKVYTTYTNSIRGVGAIRGMTAYGAYINEASLARKEVFDEITKRCSGEGARILVDTNPDHPRHWLKVNYIDKKDDMRLVYHFSIFDNPFLSERYVKNLMATTPSGASYDRGIHGLWTAGEGAIYMDFDDKKHVISRNQIKEDEIVRYIVGVDWGYDHYGVMNVLAIDALDRYILVEEHAHRHLHFEEWLEIAKDIQSRYGTDIPYYCDSARPEYVNGLFVNGMRAINANKAVVQGITEVGKQFKTDKLYIVDDCHKILDELPQYVWNDKGEKPVEINDDSLDALRYAIYTNEQMIREEERTFDR